MKYFVLMLAPPEGDFPSRLQRACEAPARWHGIEAQWWSFKQAAVLTAWNEDDGPTLVATDGSHLAVGVVRLDNRADLERWSGSVGRGLSDLALVLRTVASHGTKHIPQFQGDFSFVVWNSRTHTAVAACDAFAVRKLYYTEHNGVIALSSRAEALAWEDRYDAHYLAELVGNCILTPGLSVYGSVRALPDGSLAVLQPGRITTSRYWSAADFEPQQSIAKSERAAVESCRELFSEAVRLRLTNDGDAWAHLSGGLDSSSVVSMAQWMVERGEISHGLAGTITHVDRQGTACDERIYSEPVARRWRIRNETIVDPPLWHDGDYPLPRTDQPRMEFPFYPHDRRLCSIVRAAGGRVLLTGVGGDELFSGYMLFLADWLARGRIWPTLREMARRAAIGRVSFWQLAYYDALLPLAPAAVRNRWARTKGHVPSWVTESSVRRYELPAHTYAASFGAGRAGHKYHHALSALITSLGRLMEPGVIGDALDLRHPFLHRPLVEFALQLPPELCARPYQRKWVLREAMREILPDVVRTRIGKGSPADLYTWSLMALRPLLEPLLDEPMLADLGIIDAASLRAAFDAVPHEVGAIDKPLDSVYTTLAIEAWLQARSGRWPRGGHQSMDVTTEVHALST